MLKINNVSITFSKGGVNENQVFDNFSLEVKKGEFLVIVGGNGAGKSTLVGIISGFVKPDEGSVILDGKDVTNTEVHKRAKYIGRVFQDPMMGTCSTMSIEENLSIAHKRGHKRTLKWGLKKSDRSLYRTELERLNLGLEDRLNVKAGELSGGQRQAITLIMATMNNPDVLLLDEHTAALDPKTASKVMTFTEQIVKEKQLTTIMITHNMADAVKYGTRLIMLDKGKIIFDVSGEDKKNLTVTTLLEKFGATM